LTSIREDEEDEDEDNGSTTNGSYRRGYRPGTAGVPVVIEEEEDEAVRSQVSGYSGSKWFKVVQSGSRSFTGSKWFHWFKVKFCAAPGYNNTDMPSALYSLPRRVCSTNSSSSNSNSSRVERRRRKMPVVLFYWHRPKEALQ